MTEQTKTPMVDALLNKHSLGAIPPIQDRYVMMAELARRLETELATQSALLADMREALAECVDACRPSDIKRSPWTGSMRCPNPVVDGPKFERAELLLKRAADIGGA